MWTFIGQDLRHATVRNWCGRIRRDAPSGEIRSFRNVPMSSAPECSCLETWYETPSPFSYMSAFLLNDIERHENTEEAGDEVLLAVRRAYSVQHARCTETGAEPGSFLFPNGGARVFTAINLRET